MRFPSLPVLGFLTLGAFAPLWAADPLAAVLPENSTMFVNVGNLTKLRQSIDHPLMKSLTAGELGKALKPLLAKLEGEADAATAAIFKEETGFTLPELLAKFPGALAASVSFDFGPLLSGTGTEIQQNVADNLGLVFVADFAGDEALMSKIVNAMDKLGEKSMAESKAKKEEAAKDEDADKDADADDSKDAAADEKPLADWPEDYEETVTEVGGVKVHEWKATDPDKKLAYDISWSVVNGRALMSQGKADLKEVVGRLIKPSDAGSLASTAAWKTIPEADLEEGDVLMGVNLESMLGQIQEGLRLKMEKGELNTGGLPINPLQAWTGAGLDQFRMAYISTDLQADSAEGHMGLTYAEKPLLLKIYASKGPGTEPLFVPSDVQEVSWGTLDWGQVFDNIKELAIAVSPMAGGGMEMGLTELKKRIGVDIRTDLLGQMGDDLWSASHTEPPVKDDKKSTPETGKDEDEEEEDGPASAGMLSALSMAEGQSQVIGIALRDAKAFNLSLTSVFNTVAPGQALFDDRQFMGKTIHQVKGTPPNMSVAWLIEKDTLLLSIGKPDLLEKVLAGIDKQPAAPLINEPHIKSAFAQLPEGQISSGYVNAGQLLDVVMGAMKPLILEQADGDAEEIIKSLPDKLDLPWYTVTRAYLGDKSADVRIRLSAKP